jgi:hypothetical protein
MDGALVAVGFTLAQKAEGLSDIHRKTSIHSAATKGCSAKESLEAKEQARLHILTKSAPSSTKTYWLERQ